MGSVTSITSFSRRAPAPRCRRRWTRSGPWLDRHGIKPLGCEHGISQSGQVEVQLTFATRHEASLFERAFCDIDDVA